MSPARKRTTKSVRTTTKKVTRKSATKKVKKAATRKKASPKPARKAAVNKAARKATKKSAPKKAANAAPRKESAKAASAGGKAQPAAPAKAQRGSSKQVVARPIESAERKPGLGAKWACFSCGAKFYDLNKPDPICPKCQSDQRDQPVKPTPPAPAQPRPRPAVAPISRLLDEEDQPDEVFEDDGDAEADAELDIGKLDGDVDFIDDSDFEGEVEED